MTARFDLWLRDTVDAARSASEKRTMDQGGHFDLDGTSNTRDLAWLLGPRAPHARRILRSANLDRLSPEGRRRFVELGIGVVIDLRGKAEATEAPDLDGTRRVHLPIEPTVVASLLALQAAGTLTAASAIEVMAYTYRQFVVDHAGVYAGLLHHVLAAQQGSVLFHCAAGKDRTGIAAALILSALDLPPATIMADYLLSNRFYRPTRVASADMLPEDVCEAIIKVRPAYLDAAFAAMTEGWGGVAEYLEKALGVGPSERAALRAALA